MATLSKVAADPLTQIVVQVVCTGLTHSKKNVSTLQVSISYDL